MIIIAGTTSKPSSTNKTSRQPKRTTPSIYQKQKKRVRGFVDRISAGIVVVVIKDPEDPEYCREIYIPVSKFPKHIPEPGDYISVTINS